jgi:hypothetical protein
MSRAWLFAAALLLCGAARAGQDAALEVVVACRARLDPVTDVGIERISRRCPELLPALQRAPWRELLPRELRARREDLTAESLAALIELVKNANQETRLREAPRRADLDSILAELGAQGLQGATRWERFKRWLSDKFEKRSKDDAGWLDKLLAELRTSEGVARAITYTAYALVIALALYMVWAELRAAGLLGGARRGGAARADNIAPWRRRLALADVAAAPLADRPGLLLRLLAEALTRARRLPAPEGLTAREIARRAELDSEQDRTVLAQVAATAEQVRYAARAPADDTLGAVVDGARGLLAKIVPARGGRG